jgi:hypothetical protein
MLQTQLLNIVFSVYNEWFVFTRIIQKQQCQSLVHWTIVVYMCISQIVLRQEILQKCLAKMRLLEKTLTKCI